MPYILFHCVGQCTCPCLPGDLFTSTPHNILSKPMAIFHIIVVKTMDRNEEGGMNPAATTIVNPRKECWPNLGSNLRFSSPICY